MLATIGLVIGLWFTAAVVDGVREEMRAAPRDETGQVTESDNVQPIDLRLGDCYNSDLLDAPEDETVDVPTVEVLPCRLSHDLEIFHSLDLPDGAYPGESALLKRATTTCFRRFEGFVGMTYADSDLEVYQLIPTKRSWGLLGDHRIVCSVGDPDSRTQGTLRDTRR